MKKVEDSLATLTRPSRSNSKNAATSYPSKQEHHDSQSEKSWVDQRSKLEELLRPFAALGYEAVFGGATTSLQNKPWPERKPDAVEEAPPLEPEPKSIEIPSFTAHLAGWDQALIGIGDARRNNIPKKPLLPVR